MAESSLKFEDRDFIKYLFGSVSYKTYYYGGDATLDAILNSFPLDQAPVIGVDHTGAISNVDGNNRQFILSWRNGTNTYCWALILGFGGIWYAWRRGASTYTVTKLGGGNKRVTTPGKMLRCAA